MEHCWRSLESRQERRRILGSDAKPEARGVAKIGPGLVFFKANQANGYIVGAGQVDAAFALALSFAVASVMVC